VVVVMGVQLRRLRPHRHQHILGLLQQQPQQPQQPDQRAAEGLLQQQGVRVVLAVLL
jgi:hypothetical protein